MEASSLLAQELWDQILDYLHTSRKDLLSSALACRAFTLGAQRHLFYSIQLDNRLKASQLVETLSSSPHLIAYIRDLDINPYNPEILTLIAQVPWSHVSAISIAKHADAEELALDPLSPFYTPVSPEKRSEEPAFELLCPLISLPTSRKISIRDGAWDTHSLCAVLANCNAAVDSLAFRTCFIRASPTAHDDDPALLPRSSPHRITHLEITTMYTKSISDFLMDPSCPLDLSCLLHIKCGSPGGPGLLRLLHTVGRTIQSLGIQALDLEHLDMRAFPALSHVVVGGKGSSLRRAMERCCQSSVPTICYTIQAWTTVNNLDTIQSVILSRNPPALRKVELEIFSTEYSRAGWIALIESRMPELTEMGMLTITFP